MNKRTMPIRIAFVVLGIALLIIFKNSTPGTVGGVLLIMAGIVSLIQSRIGRTKLGIIFDLIT